MPLDQETGWLGGPDDSFRGSQEECKPLEEHPPQRVAALLLHWLLPEVPRMQAAGGGCGPEVQQQERQVVCTRYAAAKLSLKDRITCLQALQISMKFLPQMASDIGRILVKF